MDDLVIDKIVGYFPTHFFTVRCYIEHVNVWEAHNVWDSNGVTRIFNKTFYFRSIDNVNTTILAFYSTYCPKFPTPLLLTETDFAIYLNKRYKHEIAEDEENKYVYAIEIKKSELNDDIPIFDRNYFGLFGK